MTGFLGGEEALAKALNEDKPIFVSVGYAACHWCHVMSEESFESAAIAKLLNDSFVAIKIDRERRPDLDAQFSMVTSLLEGTSGWPNSVFLTPDGQPFRAGGYFPPDVFSELLVSVAEGWQNNRGPIEAQAVETTAVMRRYLDQAVALGDVTSADITKAAQETLGDLDVFYGGFGDAPKFAREVFLLFLLDQAQRTGDGALLEAVTLTLDGMLSGGVHDHVGGGFHRYAVDPAWRVPHFEKMLYTQALMGRILLRAYALTGREAYARAARRTLDYVLRDMQAGLGAFYAAEDASSLNTDGVRKEGWFYTWDGAEVDAVVAELLGLEDEGSFEGRSMAYQPNPAPSDNDLDKLRVLRDARPRPIRDEKLILSWNAEMISTLAEASRVLERPDYLQAADRAARFLLTALEGPNGFSRIYYRGQADTPAQLTDYAAFGRAMVALYDYGGDVAWLAQAERLTADLSRLADAGQAMRLTETVAGLGPIRPLDDTELASGNAMVLQLLAGVDRRQARTGEAAQALAAALAIDAIRQPRKRAGILTALEESRLGPSGPLRVSSGGAVHVLALANRSVGELRLDVKIKEGWHVNAHAPLDFDREGRVEARLTLQACNDEVCLPPDDMVFYLWMESEAAAQ